MSDLLPVKVIAQGQLLLLSGASIFALIKGVWWWGSIIIVAYTVIIMMAYQQAMPDV